MASSQNNGLSENMPGVRSLSVSDVRRVATLARLSLTDEQAELYRSQLGAVLAYMDRLAQIDLGGVEPMHHPERRTNRLDEDAPAERSHELTTSDLMAMAPAARDGFVSVPKVIGDGAA